MQTNKIDVTVSLYSGFVKRMAEAAQAKLTNEKDVEAWVVEQCAAQVASQTKAFLKEKVEREAKRQLEKAYSDELQEVLRDFVSRRVKAMVSRALSGEGGKKLIIDMVDEVLDGTAAKSALKITMPISDVELTTRTYNCLVSENVRTVSDLISMTECDLIKIPNMGRKSVNEIKEVLAAYGLSLKTNTDY